MISKLCSNHPYWGVRTLVENDHDVMMLNFSHYTYKPQSLTDERKIYSISRQDFLNEPLVLGAINSTPEDQEFALHSTILHRTLGQMHIPMIDMSTGSGAQLEKVRPVLGESVFFDFDWYKSGRSYHGYGRSLLTHNDWIKQMGKLLLVNQIGVPPTVDPRWVGHRLIAGYASLRWTKNTPQYLDYPRRVS